MPLYNYVCPACSVEVSKVTTIADRNKEKCSKCGVLMVRPVLRNTPSIGRIWPITLEHVASEPVTFQSKRELSRYCDKHKIRSNMCD